jgi:ribosomal protein S18 acetylase RimI-like enzyme
MRIEKTSVSDQKDLFELYQKVAATPGGIARHQHEITLDYISDFLKKVEMHGLGLKGVSDKNEIVGEIHACCSGLECFSHVFTDLTVVVDPDAQGFGIGRKLFESFLTQVTSEFPQIQRVELFVRESNSKAISFYQSLGFVIEGEFKNRVKSSDGTLESDIAMGWLRKDS